jgi:hypothetical protein
MTEKDITPKLLNKYVDFDESGNCRAYEVQALEFKSSPDIVHVRGHMSENTILLTTKQIIHDYLIYREEIKYAHEVLAEEVLDRWKMKVAREFEDYDLSVLNSLEPITDVDEWNLDPELHTYKLNTIS